MTLTYTELVRRHVGLIASARAAGKTWKAVQQTLLEAHNIDIPVNTLRARWSDLGRGDDDPDDQLAPDALERVLVEVSEKLTDLDATQAWVRSDGTWTVGVRRADSGVDVEAAEAFINRLAQWEPTYEAPPGLKIAGEHLLIPQVYDFHFGKRTQDGYGLNEQVSDFVSAIRSTVQMVLGMNKTIGRILFPIGNDILHVDGYTPGTTAGTLQDVTARTTDIVDAATWACFRAVDILQSVAPVTVFNVPGNHDRTLHHSVTRALWFAYRKFSHVTVDVSHNPRRYYAYGPTVMMFHHGDGKIKGGDLAGLILREAKHLVNSEVSQYRVYEGHLHIKRRMVQVIGDEVGIQVLNIPSLCYTDDWHKKEGYGSERAAEAHLIHHTRGDAGIFPVFPEQLAPIAREQPYQKEDVA